MSMKVTRAKFIGIERMDEGELRDFADDLLTENETMRAERDEWHRVAQSKQDIIDHMRDATAENAKLRELTKDMGELLDVFAECDLACKHHHDGCIGDCYYVNARRELGI